MTTTQILLAILILGVASIYIVYALRSNEFTYREHIIYGFVFGIFFVLLGSLLVYSKYDLHTVISVLVLKEYVYAGKPIYIGYGLFVSSFLIAIALMIGGVQKGLKE